MPIQIGNRPDHGFDQPLGLLSDCHRRIEFFLRVMSVHSREACGGPLGPQQRQDLDGALAYFAEAAPRHTQDEEESLFPRLRAAGDPALDAALAAVARLERDHDEAERHHAAVDRLLRHWLQIGQLPAQDHADLLAHIARLETIYGEHIAIEDRDVFPAAARSLSPAQQAEIGAEMARRRRS